MDKDNSTNKNINEEILDHLVLQVNALEKRELKLPDYDERFETIEQLILSIPDHSKLIEELWDSVSQHNLSYPAQQIQKQIDAIKEAVNHIPLVIPVKNYHHFDVKTRPFIIAGSLLIILIALSSGLNIYLVTENNRLQANDIKFRMTRQIFPVQAKTVDSFYVKNPKKMEEQTVQLETEALERSEAADLAEQKEREAREANDKLKALKKRQH